jgi:hypothetical protein
MYERKTDLLLTAPYVGVMQTKVLPHASAYEALHSAPPGELKLWLFDHAQGALWIAIAGEHAEPLTAWLDAIHDQFSCTTMLAALVNNGVNAPPAHVYAFTIPRRSLTPPIEGLISRAFTLYLPHTDEFQVLAEPSLALSLKEKLHSLPKLITGLTCRPSAEGPLVPPAVRVSSPGRYDPVEAQFREVLGPIADSARRAARDLVTDWNEILGPPVPADILELESAVLAETKVIQQLHTASPTCEQGSTLLSAVDRHARNLREMRRMAFDLSSRIREYEWPPTHRATYERVAAPLTLRALQQYTLDIAGQLDLHDYTFLPIVGRHFATTTRSFRSTRHLPERRENTAIVIEVPAEIRLRLGALPMITHEVVAVMTEKLDAIASSLVGLDRLQFPELHALLPKLRVRNDRELDSEVERHRHGVRRVGRELAANLLAAAVAGPAFIFAMARFAAGAGPAAVAVEAREELLPLRSRLSACIGILDALERPAGFISSYLPETGMKLPGEIISIVRESISAAEPPSENEICRITEALRAGRVVDAPPTFILDALWRGVATRSGYLHEIAALVSVAGV